jgi:hypothetical protein
MAKNIADALAAIVLIENAVTVSVGGTTFATRKAYAYPPPAADALPTNPAWINMWTLSRRESGHSLRELFYTVRVQLFIDDADIDRGLEAATRMHTDFIDRLDANVTLRDAGNAATVSRLDYRGVDPSIGVAERGGKRFEVMQMDIDLFMQTGFAYS